MELEFPAPATVSLFVKWIPSVLFWTTKYLLFNSDAVAQLIVVSSFVLSALTYRNLTGVTQLEFSHTHERLQGLGVPTVNCMLYPIMSVDTPLYINCSVNCMTLAVLGTLL